jgi:hypothetical protein
MKLRDIAHSRTGDKGDISNISVIPFDEADYQFLREHVTVERVRAHFGSIITGDVIRYELPSIGALNFVTRSLALDAHGKSLSCVLLTLDLPDRRKE